MSQKEIGRIGQLRYGNGGSGSMFFEEFLHELRGIKGVHAYTEMADNDATVGAIIYAIEMLMRNCEFHVEPGGNTQKDKEAAEFVESCMHDMERTWADTLSEILSFMTYGWSYHEIVYKRRVGKSNSPITNSKYTDGLIGWRKLPIRSQDTLYGWEYKDDDSDDLVGMIQEPPPTYRHITIPIEKALHFRTRSRKDNPEGRSILRTAYRAYYFKKRLEEIEGYGMERDLAGFPVLYAPSDVPIWDEDPDMQQILARAEAIVSSIRRDAREGLVLPGGFEQGSGWKLELLASGSRRQFDTNAIIDRYDKRIATSVLADFVMLGQAAVGSFALADNKTKIFALAIGTYLDVICEVFNNQGIPRLININGEHFKGITDYPKMVHGDIEERDLGSFTTFLKEMVGIGVLVPDESLEEEIRRIGKLPEKTDTAVPKEMQPGESGSPEEGETPESKSVYKIMSIVDKYHSGKLTEEAAKQLMNGLGINEQQIAFYLKEADKAPQKGTEAPQSRGNGKQEETPVDDETDAQEAQEAKKSLGRRENRK